MNDRHGVLLVMYDIPTITSDGRRESNQFRKNLLWNSFTPMQESIYIKLLRSSVTIPQELDRLKEKLPSCGTVYSLYLSLNDFKSMVTLQGDAFDMNLFSNDIIVI